MQAPTPVEKWLEEGWSPTRILYGLASAATLVVTLAGFADHAHHPGAVWWLLAGALVIALWALLEMVRWHVRHNRLQRELKAQRQAHERELAKRKRRALPEPAPMPLEPRYGDSVRYRHRDGPITGHRIGLDNAAGNPEAAGVRLEWTGMVPSPAFGAPYWERWAPNVPCPVLRVTGGYPGTGVPLPPEQEALWMAVTTANQADARDRSADQRDTKADARDRELLQESATARLQARLETMPVIEQAKGMIMDQSGCTAEA